MIDAQVSSVSRPFSLRIFCSATFLTVNEPDSVLWTKTFAGIGSMQGLHPPQMIEIDAVGAIASLWETRCFTPRSSASGQVPRSSASATEAAR